MESFKSLIKLSYPHPCDLECYGRYTKLTKAQIAVYDEHVKSVDWPGMQAAIRHTCSSCGVCAQYLRERPWEPMGSHDKHVIKHGLIKHGLIKHGKMWINIIKYSQHKQMHEFLFCSLFRTSKLLILMNQWVTFSNIIFVLWCRSANNALVKLKTTTTTKSNVK